MLQFLITFKSKKAQGVVGLPPTSDKKVQRGDGIRRQKLRLLSPHRSQIHTQFFFLILEQWMIWAMSLY